MSDGYLNASALAFSHIFIYLECARTFCKVEQIELIFHITYCFASNKNHTCVVVNKCTLVNPSNARVVQKHFYILC